MNKSCNITSQFLLNIEHYFTDLSASKVKAAIKTSMSVLPSLFTMQKKRCHRWSLHGLKKIGSTLN